MIVDLNMFSAGMKNRVSGKECSTKVVAPKDWRSGGSVVKLMKKLLYPGKFRASHGHAPILGFSAGTGNSVLFFGTPGNEVGTKKNAITGGGATIIRATCPICIEVSMKKLWLKYKSMHNRLNSLRTIRKSL
jgi:hypothetical protein